MSNSLKETILRLPVAHLRRAVGIKDRLQALENQLQDLLEAASPPGLRTVVRAKRRMSAAARARISRATKARWAKWRAERKRG